MTFAPRSRRLAAAFTLLLATLLVPAAQATTFGISPMRLDLDPGTRTGSFNITNSGDAPLTIQTQPFLWQQDDNGKFTFHSADGLLVFPKLLTVPPGETLTVRVGYQGNPDDEQFFRVMITEVPVAVQPVDADYTGGESQAGFRIALQMAMPVVFTPAAIRDSKPSLVLEDARIAGGDLQLALRNTGRRTLAKATVSVQLLDAAGSVLMSTAEGRFEYILPGARGRVPVSLDPAQCAQVARVVAVASANGTTIEAGAIDIGKPDCNRPAAAAPRTSPRVPAR